MERLDDIVKAAQGGDAEAFNRIVLRFQDMAYAAAYAHLGDHHRAQDAAQEAFVEAYLHLHRLREPAAFPGWFRQILFRQSLRLVRGASVPTAPLEAAAELPAPGPGPAEAAMAAERRAEVRGAIRSLPEHERLVVSLFYVGGYSHQEVGDFLQVPVTTVKKRLHSARRRLRERMMPMAPEEIQGGRPSRDDRFARVVQLCGAAAKGDLAAVKAALAKHPKLINGQDGTGDVALGHAARWGHREVVEYLLAHGADPRVTRGGRDQGWSALFWACGWHADPEIVTLLLDHGADAHARANHHGAAADTPLHCAARFEHPEVVALLLARGADLNATCGDGDCGYNGFTPLQVAAKRGNRGVVEVLRAHGAELDAFSAACLGETEALQALMAADPGLTTTLDEYAATPLHWAVEAGQTEAARLLIAHGGDVNARDRRGRTPLLLAALADDPALVELLLAHGAAVDGCAAAALGDEERLAGLLTATPAFAQATDERGWTALHWAARTGRPATAGRLLAAGAPVDARDGHGRTPLWAAAYEGRHREMVELLLAHGADAAAKDMFGCGLLAYDVGREIGALLRTHGAVE